MQNFLPEQTVVTVNSAETLYRMLTIGRVKVIVDARTRALQMIDALDLNDYMIAEPPLLSVSLYHYINANRQYLVQPLTKAFTEMTAEGLLPYSSSR